ncbi:hypothetical protein F5Y06DRAFT_298986 [Hypoxylon sp. FL0890]|nr:hypothetical protein F5Y06DRAFT_298986 [Hypoxylon sp. FL0890]
MTCLSSEEHDSDISDHLLHYLGCIKISERKKFFTTKHDIWKREVEHQEKHLGLRRQEAEEMTKRKRESWEKDCKSEERRIDFLRNTLRQDTDDKHLVRKVDNSLANWRRKKGRLIPSPLHVETEDYKPEKDISAPIIQFDGGKGVDAEVKDGCCGVWNKFPNQKTALSDLLHHDDNLLNNQYRSKDRVAYFHIPSNNMIWAEEAIGRYFGEGRPDYRGIRRELQRQRKTRTYMVLREPYWYNQLDGGQEHKPPHARHMRPLCEIISSNPENVDYFAENMVVFMPYLHWDTSRKREQFATEIDDIYYKSRGTPESEPRISTMRSLLKKMDLTKEKPPVDWKGRVRVSNCLGQLFIDAARLYEGMSNYRDKKILREHLCKNPPLHPRRTLDQAYHWTLRSTRKRDKDQVVYRSTTAKPTDFHKFTLKDDGKDNDGMNGEWKVHKEFEITNNCQECKMNIQKLSRVIMVDQLWMWILDAKTIITCFPKRYGANKHDASAIHKSIRVRVQNSGPDQIRTVFDLALIIIDECSGSLFDRTKAMDRQPQVVDAFSKAIGNIMHKQTAAFERLWRWTDDARKVYRSKGNGDTSELHVPLLDINPEGKIEREIKDIVEELDIMIHITKTHKKILTRFIANAETILDPFGLFGDSKKRELTGHHLWAKSEKPEEQSEKPEKLERMRRGKEKIGELEAEEGDYNWFKLNADERLEEVSSRIEELEELRKTAANTAESVKDLLELKQQQASVVQAWQAVKQSEETIKQGRSIMMFTLVTIVFLPLSFMSSVFGMNNIEITDSTWSIKTELVYMFAISAGVIFLSLLVAFSNWIRTGVFYLFKWLVTRLIVKSGIYNFWLDRDISSKTLHRDANDWSDRVKQRSREAHLDRKLEKLRKIEKESSFKAEKEPSTDDDSSDDQSEFPVENGSGETNGGAQVTKHGGILGFLSGYKSFGPRARKARTRDVEFGTR